MFIRKWSTNNKPVGSIIIVHGLEEHSGRYDPFARFLTSKGFTVYSSDLPGHGVSSSPYGHIDSFNEFFETVETLMNIANIEFPDLPLYLFGHSMGALVSIRVAQERTEDFKACVFSAPPLHSLKKQAGGLVPLLIVLNMVAPFVRFSNRIDPNKLSTNPEAVKRYINDPFVHDKISARLFNNMDKNISIAWQKTDNLPDSVMFIYGTDDTVISVDAIKEFFEKVSAKNKRIVEIEGGKHEIFEDLERKERFFNEIASYFLDNL